MLEWWNQLSLTSQVFLCAAIPATAVMILQALLLLVGIGGGDLDPAADSDFDADMDGDIDGDADGDPDGDSGGDGLVLFSVRTVVAFFSVGGWVGFAATQGGVPLAGSVPISVLAGGGAMYLIAWMLKKFRELQDCGNLDLETTVGKKGTAYLPIPPKGRGKGKVSLLLSSGYVELDAVNTGEKTIPTGTEVEVCGLTDKETLCVRPLTATMQDREEKDLMRI